MISFLFFFFQAEDGIRDIGVTGVQTCALPIFLQLPEIPKTLIVVGAGAVGVEFASIYNSFGTQVTILEALPRVVPVEDEEISVELTKAFQKKGIQIFTSCSVESVKKDAKGVTVVFKD